MTVSEQIQGLIDDLEARIPTAGAVRPALEAQLAGQRKQLEYAKRQEGK